MIREFVQKASQLWGAKTFLEEDAVLHPSAAQKTAKNLSDDLESVTKLRKTALFLNSGMAIASIIGLTVLGGQPVQPEREGHKESIIMTFKAAAAIGVSGMLLNNARANALIRRKEELVELLQQEVSPQP
jgi:hypothetical protein